MIHTWYSNSTLRNFSGVLHALLPKNKGCLNLATEVLKGFSPDVFNRLCVTHNKNLEQWKFRTKERVINLFLFKSNSENYGCQLRQLTGSIPFSIFLDTSWIYNYQLRQLTGSTGSSILDSSESYVVNSDSWQEA